MMRAEDVPTAKNMPPLKCMATTRRLPRATRRWAGSAAAVVGAMLAAWSLASGWSVQTVALRDFREAQAVAAVMSGFGLDTYTEFAMWEGQQFVRVRIGCFLTREAAASFASSLEDRVVDEAVPVERTSTAPAAGCLDERTGFLKPPQWRQLAAGAPAFEVAMGDVAAVIEHTGERWRVVQDESAPPTVGHPRVERFAQGLLLGQPVVEVLRDGQRIVLCPGVLVAQVGEVAVVERSDRIVSCRLRGLSALAESN